MATTIRPKFEDAPQLSPQTASRTAASGARAPQRTQTTARHEAPPSYQEATRPTDAFNAPRYTPRRVPERQAAPLDVPSSASGASSRLRSVRSNSSDSSSSATSKRKGKTAQQAIDTLKSAWDPTPGIHYYDGAKPIVSNGDIVFEAYKPNPKQTRGEAVQQRKLEGQWIRLMGPNAPFPGNARHILKEEAAYDGGYGGPEKIKGKVSTFGKITQKLAGKGNSRTLAQDIAVYKERWTPTAGIQYFVGGAQRESNGIAFAPYTVDAKQTKKEAIRQRKLEAVWVRRLPGEPFPANARTILQDDIANDPDPITSREKLP